jgi:hypothetical protein
VRPIGNTAGELRIRANGRVLTKRIVAGKSVINGYSHGPIEIRYPHRSILGANWMVWFFLISSAAALVYR